MKDFPHVLEGINDLSTDHVQNLLHSANRLKNGLVPLGARNLGRNLTPIVATSFLENSTRTKHSFAIAIQRVGAMYLDFDTETSSLKKGENLEETLLTLRYQGVDLCIIRTSVSHELAQFKENPPVQIINGGDGINQHPTQALLDLMTMVESNLGPKGKTVAIIGDCIHSRVGHSLIDLIPQFGGNIILCGPEVCLPKNFSHPNVTMTTDIDEAIRKSDILYTLRIQKERHLEKAPYYDNYLETYGISLERLKKMNKLMPVFHPGPANIGVEIDNALLKSPYYFGYQQVINSVYMRMAIVKAMLWSAPPVMI